jgi:hypothetical protein
VMKRITAVMGKNTAVIGSFFSPFPPKSGEFYGISFHFFLPCPLIFLSFARPYDFLFPKYSYLCPILSSK